jgi:hypothetical protein
MLFAMLLFHHVVAIVRPPEPTARPGPDVVISGAKKETFVGVGNTGRYARADG